jgi:hypothetical protein
MSSLLLQSLHVISLCFVLHCHLEPAHLTYNEVYYCHEVGAASCHVLTWGLLTFYQHSEECGQISIRLHGVTSRKILLFIFNSGRTSNLTHHFIFTRKLYVTRMSEDDLVTQLVRFLMFTAVIFLYWKQYYKIITAFSGLMVEWNDANWSEEYIQIISK